MVLSSYMSRTIKLPYRSLQYYDGAETRYVARLTSYHDFRNTFPLVTCTNMWDFDCVDWMAKGEGVMASRQGAHMRFEDFGPFWVWGASFPTLVHHSVRFFTRHWATESFQPFRDEVATRSFVKSYSLLSSILFLTFQGGLSYRQDEEATEEGQWQKKPKLSDAQTAQIASTQEQAAQLIASMVGPAWGSLLNICRVVLLHCAALHSIQFPRFCMWWPLSLHSLVFWSFQTITALLLSHRTFESDDFRNEFGSSQVQWLHPSSLLVFSRNTMPDIAKSDISPNLDRDKMSMSFGGWTIAFVKVLALELLEIHSLEVKLWTFAFTASVRWPTLVTLSAPTSVFAYASRTSAPYLQPQDHQFAFASTKSLQVMMDGVANSSLIGLPALVIPFGSTTSSALASASLPHKQWPSSLCRPDKGVVHQGWNQLATPMEGGKLCSSVSTRLCFWDQCAMPPAEGAPMFSCFNLLNSKGASAKPLAYGSWDILSQVSTSNADVLLWYCEQPCSTKVFEHGVFLSFVDLLASCQGNGVSDEASLHRFLFVTGTLPNLAGWKKKVLAI